MRWPTLLLSLYCAVAPATPKVARQARSGPDLVTGQLTVKAPVADVLAALQAPCAVRQWLAGLDELKVLAHPAPDQTLVYTRQNLPWPWQSRDVVSRFTRHGQPGDAKVTIDQANVRNKKPPHNGVVRIPWLRARWSLRRQQGHTHIRYRQRIKLGGSVPQWLTDRSATHVVRDSLQGLEHYLGRPASQACARQHARAD